MGLTLPPDPARAQALPRPSLLDARRDRARGAEGRDDRGVLARPARDDHHQILRARAERHLFPERPIVEARGVDPREALAVRGAEAVESDAGALPDRPLHVGL